MTGNKFPGIAFVQMVDEANGYVLVKLNPWTVWQPGIWQAMTYSQDQTYTIAQFRELAPKMKMTGPNILKGLYDSTRGLWTNPIPTEPYKFS